MSKSKSKGSKGAAPVASDTLTKVKDAAITKPAQAVKAKGQEFAKQVAGKEEKKNKSKKTKEPTPESSEDASDHESDEAASSDDSESEVETRKPVQTGKANGIAKVAKKDESDEESDSEESASSDDETPTNGVKAPAVKKVAAASSDEEEDDDSDDEESDNSEAGVATGKATRAADSSEEEEEEEDSSDEEPTASNKKGAAKPVDSAKKVKLVADDSSDEDDESDADSDDSEADSSDEAEEEVVPKRAQAKRKAEDEATPAAKKSKTAETDSAQGGNLFIGNLSWNVDEDWLTREFEEFGELTGVRLITDRDTGRSKGFGYVEFANAADAAKAHSAKNGALVDNRALNVDFANSKPAGGQQDRAQSRAKSFGDSTSPPSDTLFVGNLSFDVGQESVSEAFGEYGTILGVRLPTDRETGEPKGFGYVTFSSVDEAKAALENMQGYEISGRACRLDYSQPRPQNGESPGRGGRGGGRGGFDRGRGRGGFDRGGRGGGRGFGGGRGRGGFDRGGRGGGRGASTNRGGFGDFAGKKVTF